jgi:glyoxylase-like metal-dependent hydrolase (beta-lactamase superfamily II)
VRFGRFDVTLFSDGIFRLDGGLMFGVVPRVIWQRHIAPDERNRISLHMNCLLVRDDRHVVLLETGIGDKLDARLRDLYGVEREDGVLGGLARLGVQADDVTLVINTHLHFDHSGGNTRRDADGLRPGFRRARYVFQRLEWEDALHPHERSRASYFADDFAPLENAVELLDGDAELLPGLRLVRIQGHTRGTQCLLLEQEGRSLFFSSDFMPTRHHLPIPWIPAIDLYPMDSLSAKKTLLPRAAEEEWLVAFTHDVPRFGYVRRREGKFVFEERERS